MKLNYKQLLQDSTALDKSKIFIADVNLHNETQGAKRLLSPQEDKDITLLAEKENQLQEINRVGGIFNAFKTGVFPDLQIRFFSLRGTIKELEKIMLCLYTQNYYQVKHKGKEIIPQLSIWEKDGKPQPNILVQKKFREALRALKSFHEGIYQIDYLIEKAGFNFLDKDDLLLRDLYEKKAEEWVSFTSLECLFSYYRECFSKKEFQKFFNLKHFEFPDFLEATSNPQTYSAISNEDKRRIREDVDNYIQRRSPTHY